MIDAHAIHTARQNTLTRFAADPSTLAWRDRLASLPDFSSTLFEAHRSVVKIGSPSEGDRFAPGQLTEVLKTFMPWKKGPFCFFGETIDAEWRSDLKWSRIEGQLDELSGKSIADIGCNNGYFMFRAAAHQPREVIGFEPVAKHWYTFNLLNRYAACGNLRFEPLGLDHLRFFSGHFDIVFCMGILYHHTDPMQVLRLIHQALKPGGQLVIDCQGIAGRDPVALTPRQRYAGAKGIWFLPTLPCLENWVARANFRSLDAFYDAPLSQEEQRATPWSPGQSLGDFIDPQDPLQTIEGYPAPRRFYVSARK